MCQCAAVVRAGNMRLHLLTQLTVLTAHASGDRECLVSLDEKDALDVRSKDTLSFIDGWETFLGGN
jgi:hypothetical protein